jgi:hypothetical protein
VLARAIGMARRAGLLAVVLAALVAPTTVQAADVATFQILRNACTTTGGDFHHGEVLLKVKVTENGSSGANKFTLTAVAQHHKASTNSWINEYQFDTVKVTFPDDANSYYHTRWYAYDPKDKSEHRIRVVIKVWHNKSLLASKTFTSKAC